jgi:hypothetical protein
MELRLSRSLFTNFSFIRWNFDYHGAFSQTFFFIRWNFSYHGAFSQTFLSYDGISAITEPSHKLFFSYDGTSAITEPFLRTFFSYDGILAITESSHKLFFSYVGTSAITEPFYEVFCHTLEFRLSQSLFTNFSFIRWNFARHTFWGKTLFIYITKSIYIGSASLKTLPPDLEPPLHKKEYDTPYF